MANQKRVTTSYDSGGKNTAKKTSSGNTDGDWGNDTPQKNDENDSLLGIVLDDFKKARDYYKDNYQSNHEDYWKVYNNIRVRRNYEGISDDFVPETFTIIESVKANIAGGKPKFTYVPMNEEQRQDTLVLNQLVNYYWGQNQMTQKTLDWVQDMLVYGTGVLMVCWEKEMPYIRHIPLQDFFVDPTATHINRPSEPGYPKYAGYRYLTDRSMLADEKLLNPETGEMEDRYKNLDQIADFDDKWDKLDKETKEGFIGSTLGNEAYKSQVEIIEYYTKKKKIVVANRSVVIYEGRNPYFRKEKTENVTVNMEGATQQKKQKIEAVQPFLPFAVLRNYVDGSLFYAKGDVAQIVDLQESLNDVSNQKKDNLAYVLNNMWQIDPQFSHLADQVASVPGLVLPIPKGAIAPIEKEVVTTEADAEMARIQDQMRRATAADEVVQGAMAQNSRTTATEINATVNQANQRFATKLATLEGEGYAQLGRILFKMIQIFVTTPMAVRIVGPDGVAWKDFDPFEYNGEYEPLVSLESTQKVVRAEEGQKYLLVHQTFANSPNINQKEFARLYLEKVLDLPESRVKELMNVPPPPDTPPMPEPSVSFKVDLMPDQQAQILSKYGIQTSQADLMLGAGMTANDISSNVQTPAQSPAVLEDPNMASAPQGSEGAPSMDSGAGPAGPTPPVAMG